MDGVPNFTGSPISRGPQFHHECGRACLFHVHACVHECALRLTPSIKRQMKWIQHTVIQKFLQLKWRGDDEKPRLPLQARRVSLSCWRQLKVLAIWATYQVAILVKCMSQRIMMDQRLPVVWNVRASFHYYLIDHVPGQHILENTWVITGES